MKVTAHEMTKDFYPYYLEMHNQVFAEDYGHMPSLVYLAHDEEGIVGFVAGYRHRLGTFYVSKMGVMPGRKRDFKYYTKVWEAIKESGFKTILGMIENTNKPVLMRMLRDGFTICGFRVADVSLVEVMKEL